MTTDDIHRLAKRAAGAGVPLNDACPRPFDTPEGRLFKEVFIMHRAALIALGLDDKPLTTN